MCQTLPAVCRVCEDVLSDENWAPSYQIANSRICNVCNHKRVSIWQKENPDKKHANNKRYCRKIGMVSFRENKECTMYLGVHIAEDVLSHVFKDVKRMPNGNPGYDFICNRGKRIDVKSACLGKTGNWMFGIKKNTIADYFLCLIFNNRKDLNPLRIWLLPGEKFNHLTATSISPSTIDKWNEYQLDINKVIACCDVLRVDAK